MILSQVQDIKNLTFMKSNKTKKVFVEVAKTPSQQSKGLMFRDGLAEDSGMIFVFESPKILSFWGMNTFIPLDIAFVDDEGVIKDIKRIKKHDLNSVKSSCPCRYAIEMEDGWFNKNGFSSGDFVELSTSSSNFITFIKNIENKNIKLAQLLVDKDGKVEGDIDSFTDNTDDINDIDDIEIEDESNDIEEIKNLNDTEKDIVEKPIQSPARDSENKSVDVELNVPKFSNIFEAMGWAISNSQVVRITYKTKKGHTVTRDVEPHRAFFSRKSKRQVLKAYDETSGHPSNYIIMNIISFGFPGRKFIPKSIFNKRR